MDIKKLEYFVRIVECGGYSCASKVLFVSQPTLSKAVKSLENRLGVQLFTTFGRRVQPTEHGQHLYERAKELIAQHESIIESIRHSSNFQSGNVRLGVPPIIGPCIAASFVSDFLAEYPRVSLQVRQRGASYAQRMTDGGELDVSFVIMPVSYSSLEAIPIKKDRNVVIVSDKHKYAKENKQTVVYDDLRDEQFILLDEEYTLFSNILAGCREAEFDPNIALRLAHWDFVVELVKRDMGISIVPRSILEHYSPSGISTIDLKHPSGEWNVAMVFRKGNSKSFAVSAFISHVLRQIDQPD